MKQDESKQVAHTPGPWKWYEQDSGSHHRELYPSDLEGEGVDAICFHGSDWPMTEANAQLIAQAPETARKLAEAIEALKAWEAFWDDMPKGQLGKIVCNIGLLNDAFIKQRAVLEACEATQ